MEPWLYKNKYPEKKEFPQFQGNDKIIQEVIRLTPIKRFWILKNILDAIRLAKKEVIDDIDNLILPEYDDEFSKGIIESQKNIKKFLTERHLSPSKEGASNSSSTKDCSDGIGDGDKRQSKCRKCPDKINCM